jgi:hypothetical protein
VAGLLRSDEGGSICQTLALLLRLHLATGVGHGAGNVVALSFGGTLAIHLGLAVGGHGRAIISTRVSSITRSAGRATIAVSFIRLRITLADAAVEVNSSLASAIVNDLLFGLTDFAFNVNTLQVILIGHTDVV